MNKISGMLDQATGNLFLSSIDLLISKELKKDNFLAEYGNHLLHVRKGFFKNYGFFHFSDPVNISGFDFRLSIFFLAKGKNFSSVCTGYGLREFNYEGSATDAMLVKKFNGFLDQALGIASIVAPYGMGRIWRTQWGAVYLGETQQDGTEPKISIGWNEISAS